MDDEGPGWEGELVHAEFEAFGGELVHVVLDVAVAKALVQAVEPVGGRGHVAYFLEGDVGRNEFPYGMADEEVGFLDVVPDPVPDFGGRCAFLVCQVGSDLDVAAEDDWTLRVELLCDLDETGHLRVVDDDHVRTSLGTWGKGARGTAPESVGVLLAPFVEDVALLLGEAEIWIRNTLEDVVVVLGDAEDFGLGLWHIPRFD